MAALDALAETPVLTLPARAQLVDAALAAGDAELAQDAAQRIADLAAATDTALHRAHRDHAAGKVALARGDGEATGLLRSAALGFAQSGAPLAACRARMDLARSLVGKDRGLAITEARSALQAFDRMGATAEADRAAAFLRGLGVKGRTGPRDGGPAQPARAGGARPGVRRALQQRRSPSGCSSAPGPRATTWATS